MNKKAFTLAELIAVVTILGIIALIVFPVVNQSVKESKQQAYEEQKNLILRSARNWGLENTDQLSKTSYTYVTIEELKKAGYIEKEDVINPSTEKEMDGCIVISYDTDYKQYNYNYNEKSCDELKRLPIITLNGNAMVKVEKGNTYTDAGAIATYQGTDISDSIVVTNNVDTSKVGTYTVKYNVTYNGNKAEEVIRTVKVVTGNRTFLDEMTDNPDVMNNDPDGNLRYVGADPDNYVKFNNELWRIIGLFDGQIKIIRTYTTTIAWDASNKGNDWTEASLQTELNGSYLSSIETTSKSYIDQEYVWNIGGTSTDSTTWTRANMYNYERGIDVPNGNPTTWKGAIGLMYPSDYGYSTSSTSTNCDLTLNNWSGYSDCKDNAWIYDGTDHQWTLTTRSNTSNSVFLLYNSGYVSTASTTSISIYGITSYWYYTAQPVLFLKPAVEIIGGTGTSSDPFILYMEQ